VTAHILDDLSGNAGAGYTSSPSQIRFVSPSGQQSVWAMLAGYNRVSGTATDGNYEYSMTVPRFSEQGTWHADYLMLVDQVGNTRTLRAADLTAKGFPTTFAVSGSSDTTAPTLADFSFTPNSVDTSTGAQTITVSAHILDDLAGNAGDGYTSSPTQVRFVSPSGQQNVTAMLAGYNRVSGTATDGYYEYVLTLPRYSEQGTWHIDYMILVDQVGNTRTLRQTDLQAAGFPTTFDQTGAGDSHAPTLSSFSLSTAAVDTSAGDATITVSAHILDDLAGNAGDGYTSSPSQVRFVSPSGQQSVWAMLAGYNRASGDANDGVYEYAMSVPQYSECGVWHVDYMILVDQVGNTDTVRRSDLEAAGFPATFTNC
jgi:hypothetical protein